MKGTIIKIVSDTFTVKTPKGNFECKARGNLRFRDIFPLVGDEIEFDVDNLIIERVIKRRNSLVRPPVANMDQVLIITSVKKPNFSSNLLDKMLCIIEYSNILPIICFSKVDLALKNEYKDIVKYYKSIGYEVLLNTEIKKIKKILAGKVTIIAGQSGVGKSSLLNRLDPSLQLKTDEISESLGRGKHTTRHVELFDFCKGMVADTPGFSSLDFDSMTKEDIRDNFIEFNKYRHKCKYASCMHIDEEKCEIKKQVIKGNILESRYKNYVNFIINKRWG